MTQEQFKNLMFGLSSYFDRQIDEALISIYWQKLKHFSYEQVHQAFDDCMMELKYFPKLAEIFTRVKGQKQIESAGSLSWCENTQRLIDEYS